MQLAGEVTDFKTQVITSAQVSSIPAIKVNPFKDQICKVFSWNKEGLFSFEEFLEMMSVFSENASLSIKTDYAFRIYDLNGNDYIDQEDLRNIILRLTNEMMDEANISVLIHYILDEGDLNNDGMLSFSEFKNVIERSPDFQKEDGRDFHHLGIATHEIMNMMLMLLVCIIYVIPIVIRERRKYLEII
ncbi:calcium and integrin-binding family member 4-like [Scyliorhinus canicula]|uniref:calcium and integrin-binding family member 4-like n=1 Tax=Scyliorhinus canicula TaxID=7830 RepID=UPI0018F2AADA|nr:calcium and integrin-binding family member 4-like [Scyliorhinus canicula]